MNQQRLERIRLLSARFHALQGLRIALAGAAITITIGTYLIATPVPTNDGALIALGVSALLMIPGMWWAHRYYASTFGRQVWKPRPHGYLFLFGYVMIASILNAAIPSLPAGSPTLGIVTVVSAWIAIRDWPWRAYYLVAPAAVAITFTFTASGGGSINPEHTLALLFLAVGVSFILIGILDHLVLVKLVKEVRESESAPAAESY